MVAAINTFKTEMLSPKVVVAMTRSMQTTTPLLNYAEALAMIFSGAIQLTMPSCMARQVTIEFIVIMARMPCFIAAQEMTTLKAIILKMPRFMAAPKMIT